MNNYAEFLFEVAHPHQFNNTNYKLSRWTNQKYFFLNQIIKEKCSLQFVLNRSILKIVNSSSTYWMCLDNKVLASSDYSNEHGKFDHPSIFLPPISLRRHLTLHLTDWISLFFSKFVYFSHSSLKFSRPNISINFELLNQVLNCVQIN